MAPARRSAQVSAAACVVAYDAFGIVLGEDQFTSVNLVAIVAGVVAVAGGLLIIPVWMAMGWAVGSRSGAAPGADP